MMNKKRTCTTGRIKYALFAPLTAALLLMSNIETVARTTERITKEVAETIKAIQAPAPKVAEAPAVVYQDDDPIFNIVTEMPLFVDGGMGGCLKYLINNTKYPEQAQKDKISGKVAVKFVIEKDGSITNAKITKSDNPIFNEEALRVVNSMPKWKPGKQKGKEVRVYYTVPVMFSPNGNGYQKAMDSIEGKTQADNSDAKPKYGPNKDGSYNIVDVMPEFPGGMGACLKYIMSHAKYPAEAQAKKQQGKVLVQCIIEKDGTVSNPTIMEGVSPELNEEAVRIIKSMPRWMPGKHKGKAVPVRYTLPVIFRLQ